MSNPTWIGRSLNTRYRIEEIVGQGGMSAVYKATDPNLGRVVAIKLIHPHLSDNPDFLRRFEEEARAVAQLRHPNIIQVYDFNHDENVYYIVLEFVPGETLQGRLTRLRASGRNMPLKEVVQYGANLCDAADYAHQRSMIHRDIKPANLMLNVMGQAILMDFGIAKLMGGQQHTATGAVIGTARYMSPEQIKGERVDERSDIYSIGVTLFEMLSGRPPFEADSAMTLMMMHLHDPLPNLRNIRPEVPAELVAVVEKALAKSPEERFQSAAAMALALRKAGEGEPTAQSIGKTLIEKPVEIGAAPPKEPEIRSTSTTSTAAPSPTGEKIQLEDATITASPTPPGAPAFSPKQEEPIQARHTTTAAPPQRLAPRSRLLADLTQNRIVLGIIGVVVIAVLVVAGILVIPRLGGNQPATVDNSSLTQTTEARILAIIATASTPTETIPPSPTATPDTPTPTQEPTSTPTQTLTPTATVPPGIPFVRINRITINDKNQYVVEYETFEYTEKLPGMHVHFFFNTVSPENAGSPGSGPWELYGGPRPFTVYTVSDRPAAATQMCALVANSNHSIQFNSGNCVDLPGS